MGTSAVVRSGMNSALQHADFVGGWRISRQIDDTRAGSTARFEGRAEISEAADRWRYAESGILSLSDSLEMQAERVYFWQPVVGGFDLFFEDGRAFHPLRFGAPKAAHWCDPDQYDVRYEFADWPLWRAIWCVRGPRKDYKMISEMRR